MAGNQTVEFGFSRDFEYGADGRTALPHDEVESSQFYKHIESGLPEPRRMRQLLTWCGTRALADKPSFASEDSGAKLAGKSAITYGQVIETLLNHGSARDTATTPQRLFRQIGNVRLVQQGTLHHRSPNGR